LHLRHTVSRGTSATMKFILSAFVALTLGTELTKETWDAAVAGKTVFVKFQAPW